MLHLQHKKYRYASRIIASLAFGLLINNEVWAGDVSVTVADSAGTPVENAVVYAEAVDKPTVLPVKPAMIEQKNRTFIPLVTVVQAGSSITFPNHDSVRHHVYSFSPAKAFELKLYSGVPSSPVIFDKPGTVVLGCNIHDFMIAFVHIVDTPYFAKTDVNGMAKLSNLPTGQYTLKTWHYALTKENAVVEQAVSVKGNEQAVVTLELKPFPLPKRPG